jgi:hypothetical protein
MQYLSKRQIRSKNRMPCLVSLRHGKDRQRRLSMRSKSKCGTHARPWDWNRLTPLGCGCSSGVEHNLAKVGVEGSNPFARSRLIGQTYAAFLRGPALGKSIASSAFILLSASSMIHICELCRKLSNRRTEFSGMPSSFASFSFVHPRLRIVS